MTEQKKYEIPAPPKATNYKIKLEVWLREHWGGMTAV